MTVIWIVRSVNHGVQKKSDESLPARYLAGQVRMPSSSLDDDTVGKQLTRAFQAAVLYKTRFDIEHGRKIVLINS